MKEKEYEIDSIIKGIDESINVLKIYRKRYVKTVKQLIKMRKICKVKKQNMKKEIKIKEPRYSNKSKNKFNEGWNAALKELKKRMFDGCSTKEYGLILADRLLVVIKDLVR